ncbi:MAG: hypothetical protein P8Y64_13610 [Gammaproteobacteria bacterium]|jgi:uncharacterized membrane protein YkoI
MSTTRKFAILFLAAFLATAGRSALAQGGHGPGMDMEPPEISPAERMNEPMDRMPGHDEADHYQAEQPISSEELRELEHSGKIMSLHRLLDMHHHDALRVLDASIEREAHDAYRYEIKFLTPDGRVIEREYNAVTGARLSNDGD